MERLNAENNDLTQKLQAVIKERDEALFNRQVTETQVAEQKLMIAKLLHSIRSGASGAGRSGNGLFMEFQVPHNMSKKQAIGYMGRVEKMHGELDPGKCPECCTEPGTKGNDVWNSLDGDEDYVDPADMQYIRNDINPAKLANLEARVASLIAERDGIAALLTKRISALQASLVRVRSTLCDRLEKAES